MPGDESLFARFLDTWAERSLSRRQLLKTGVTAMGTAIAAVIGGRAWNRDERATSVTASAGPGSVREGRWVQATAGDFSAGHLESMNIASVNDGVLQMAPGASWAQYTSPPKGADFPFNAVGLHWRANLPAGLRTSFSVRAQDAQGRWTEWSTPVTQVDRYVGTDIEASDLVFLSGRVLQYRVTVARDSTGPDQGILGQSVDPIWRLFQVTAIYLDSSAGPTVAEARALGRESARVAAVAMPTVIPRAAWGANESHRFYNGQEVWPRVYQFWTKCFVHHTVTSDGGQDPAAVVRAIYYYHAVTLGWGDIGYNFLIDKSGNVYEGRYGGIDMVAGHALQYNPGSIGIAAIGDYHSIAPDSRMLASYVNVFAWIANSHGIDPLGSGYFIDKTLPNIMGHRQAIETSCPGQALFDRIQSIREQVWNKLPVYGEAWVGHQTPAELMRATLVTVNVTVRNGGRATWVNTGTNRFRLGYHWYRANGTQYDEPGLEMHTDLPVTVPPGGETTVAAKLKVPSQTGSYIVKWDMVQEAITWFAQTAQGNPTLDVSVSVHATDYYASWGNHNTAGRMLPGDTNKVQVTITNSGSKPWPAGGSNPVHLGYHWYDASGQQVTQSPQDDHRTALPRDIAPGETVTLNALLTAPGAAAPLTLKWDMVLEGVTWFAAAGSPTLNTSVVIGPTNYLVGWGADSTPATMFMGQTATVSVTLTNKGTKTWGSTGKNAFRLGYHWYSESGKQYLQPAQDDYRTYLPKDLAPGETVTLSAPLTAPADAGAYILKWDMVYEGVTWFAATGSQTLDRMIQVNAPNFQASPTALSLTAERGSVVTGVVALQGDATGWQASASPTGWLSVQPVTNTVPGAVTVRADSTGLAPGRYQGVVVIKSVITSTAIVTRTVEVTFAVQPGPTTSLDPPAVAEDYSG